MGKLFHLPPPDKVHTYLVLSDLHLRYIDRKAFTLTLSYFQLVPMEQRKILLLGDILDLPYFYSKSDIYRSKFKDRDWDFFIDHVREEMELFDQLYVFLRGSVLDPEDIKYCAGNHEGRLSRENFINRVPVDLRENFNIEYILKGRIRGMEVIQYNDSYRLPVGPGLRFTHGMYCGLNVCKKHFMVYNEPVMFGHTHEIGAYAPKTADEKDEKVCWNVPCMCTGKAGDYMRGSANNWSLGFGVVNADPDTYTVQIMQIKDNKLFLPTGERFMA